MVNISSGAVGFVQSFSRNGWDWPNFLWEQCGLVKVSPGMGWIGDSSEVGIVNHSPGVIRIGQTFS